MTAKEKALDLVKKLEREISSRDIYWNGTQDAKDYAKLAIDNLCETSEYWEDVKKEIDLLPEYV